MKVVILSCGSVASDVAHRLAAEGGFDEMVVADLDVGLANELAAAVDFPHVTPAQFDAADPASIAAVLVGADIVFNGVGPYFRFGQNVVEQAIAAGAHYVDVCDEYDTTEALVNNATLDQAAQDRGLTVLTCMGAAPGLTNLAARWAINQLDRADSVAIVLGVSFFVNLGATINEHMLHCFDGDVTQFIDGRYQQVPGWGDPQRYELLPPFDKGDFEFGYFGHAESISLPRYVDGLQNVTTRFTWFQPEGNKTYQDLERLGMTSTNSEGLPMSTRHFTALVMASEAGQQAMSVPVDNHPVGNLWHIEVTGELDGKEATMVVEGHVMFDRPNKVPGQSLTAIPAVLGLCGLMSGEITRRGVVAPEACIDPEPFLRKAYAELYLPLYTRLSFTEQVV